MDNKNLIGKYCKKKRSLRVIKYDELVVCKIVDYKDNNNVEIQNPNRSRTEIYQVDELIIINDYKVPEPKYKIGEKITIKKNEDGIKIKCVYNVIDLSIFYQTVTYTLEDDITKNIKNIKENYLVSLIDKEDDDNFLEEINTHYEDDYCLGENVYVTYVYNEKDCDYKNGKIVKKYSQDCYIVKYDNGDIAIVSKPRLQKSVEI